jgi:hypothetical protein
MNKFENRYEYNKKFQEYEMKIVKMAGHLSDYYIDRALESDDFSTISGFLIDYFSGPAGKLFDVGYLVSNVDEWYKIKYEAENHVIPLIDDESHVIEMNEDEYIQYMIEKRKKEINE